MAVTLPIVMPASDRVIAVVLMVPAVTIALLARVIFQGLSGTAVVAAVRPLVALVATGTALTAMLLTWGATAAFGDQTSLPYLAAEGALIATGLQLGSFLRYVELRRWGLSRRVFFIGSERQHSDLRREILRRGDLRLVGFVEQDRASRTSRETLARQITEARPTTLALSSDATRDEHLVAVASDLHANGLRVRGLRDFYEQHFAKVPLSDLSQAWFLFDVAEIHRPRIYGRLKRGLETIVAASLLVLSAPLVPLIVLFVKLSDGGPVFYRQERVGKGGEVFTLLKFRTMTSPSEAVLPGWASEHATRITSTGRRLRRFRLDEIPQLWSVVNGDLALVGPRPEQPAIVAQLSEVVDFYGARHTVRPGLTGWAQVNHGYAGSIESTLEKLQYDFFYIRHQSLRLDVLILIATVRTILSGRGS